MEARTRVLVVETPHTVMGLLITRLRKVRSLDIDTVAPPVAAEIKKALEATCALAVVVHVEIDAWHTVQLLRDTKVPFVAVVPEGDAAGAYANERGVPVVELPRKAPLELSGLVLAIEQRAAKTLEEERLRLHLKLAGPYLEHPDAPKTSRVMAPAPDLANEVAFRAKHRHRASEWLGRPVSLRDPDAPSPPAYVEPTDCSPLLRLSMLEAFGEPGGANVVFAIRALQTADDRNAILDMVGAILVSRGQDDPELRGHCAKALLRVGDVDRAEELLRKIADPDARVLAADIAHARGREDEALQTVEATAGVRLETLGLIERIARWRDAVHAPAKRARSVVPLCVDGVRWTIVFDTTALLGRSDAPIVVRAPLVSRKHILFRQGPEGPEAVDVGSQHGTFLDGGRLAGPQRIDRARELRLADAIVCDLRPSGDDAVRASGGVVVRVADERWLLTFGRPATVGRISLEWREGVLSARADEPFLVEPGATTGSDVRLPPAALIRDRDGGPVVLAVEADAFEP